MNTIERNDAEGGAPPPDEHFRFFADSLPDLVWSAGPDGRTDFCNRRLLDYLGCSPDESLGWALAEAVHPDDRERVRRAFQEGCAAGTPSEIEYRLRRRDGQYRWQRVRASPLRDAGGDVVRWFGTCTDIDDRKRTAEALREQTARLPARAGVVGLVHDLTRRVEEQARSLAAVLAASVDHIYVLDRHGRYLQVSSGGARALGLEPAEMAGKTWRDLRLPGSQFERLDVQREQVLATGQVQRHELVWPTPSGEKVFEYIVAPAPGVGGAADAVVMVSRDVTDRRRAETALRESEERFRDLFENAHDVIYTLDLDGRLTSVNRRAELTFGYSRGECLGLEVILLVPPEYHPRMREALDRKMENGEVPTVYELEVISRDGRRVPLEVSSRLIVRGGRPVGIQGIARDVTERKRAEEALREADRRKDEFLAMLAHELRNPLAPLRNAVQLLKVAGSDGAAVARARALMERQVEYLVRLVDDLLDVSRVLRGKVQLRRERLALAAAVGRAVEIAQPAIDAGGHALEVELSEEPVWLEGDPIRLAQVIANLLTNAAKYSERAGRIWLSGGREGTEAVVRVRDTGVGISAELLPHIFQLFVQADRSRGLAQGGLGVGLTVVRSLVELHGGRVTAHSEGPGRGSEFVVHLPAVPQAAGEPEARFGPALAAPPRRRVLVVDDNVDAAESLGELLRLEGHEVRVAHDGPSALEAAAVGRPELVVLDLGMPGMDGFEVARRLRRLPGLEGVVVVALTGWGQDDDRRRSREAGFNHHLVKPAGPEAIQQLLAKLPRG
jgi:PAS domain S-box-containing protein